MPVHNPRNWHWVNKDTSGWAREYLDTELVGISAEENGVSAKIDKVLSMEGDADVSQRKGKVITIFDVKVQLEYSGKTKDDEDVSGTITIPEVAHDTEEDEYVFDIDIYTETSSKQPVKDLVRAKITPQLRKKLATLGPALMTAHGKDIQHDPSSEATFTPVKVYSSSSVNKSSSSNSNNTTTSTTSSGKGPSVNVTTVSTTEEFRTTAAELYATFTEASRIAAFTRASPKVFTASSGTASEGTRFEIFGGNVSGEYKQLSPPTRIVQAWRLAQWPAGHFSELEIKFDQNDSDGVTLMRVEWRGVPVGQEEVTRRNWGEYYVRSIKTTFGFGAIL